jgi:hypothetical protein
MPPARVLRLRMQAAQPVEIGKLEKQPIPVPKDYRPTVVPGARTRPTPRLDAVQVRRLADSTLLLWSTISRLHMLTRRHLAPRR